MSEDLSALSHLIDAGLYGRAKRLAQELLSTEASPERRASLQLLKAYSCEARNELEEARSAFDAAFSSNNIGKPSPKAFAMYGNLLVDAERTQEAESVFRRGILSAQAQNDKGWRGICRRGLGDILSNKNQYAEAVSLYQEAADDLMAAGYHIWDTLVSLGAAHRGRGEVGLARDAFQRALAVRPPVEECSEILAALAQCEHMLGLDEKATEYLEEAKHFFRYVPEKRLPAALMTAAATAWNLDDHAESVALYQRVLASEAKADVIFEARQRLMEALYLAKRYDASLKSCRVLAWGSEGSAI